MIIMQLIKNIKILKKLMLFVLFVLIFLFQILKSDLNDFSDLNYYEILNIDQNANKNEIKKAFKKLVLKYHPDHNKVKYCIKT